MKKVGSFLVLLAALVATPVFSGVASAHVEMTPSEAPAGKPVDLGFEIPHGCDGAATTSIVVQIPKGARNVKAGAVKGWQASSAGATLTWTGGPLPDHQTQDFPFRATLYGKEGETVMFKTIQKCQGGTSTAWIQAMEGDVEPEYPAPAVTLTSTEPAPVSPATPAEQQAADDQVAESDSAATGEPTATAADADDSSSDDDGSDSKTLILIVIAGLAIGTVAGIVVRARRRQ